MWFLHIIGFDYIFIYRNLFLHKVLTSICVILQDPQAAIPKGTLLAILITGITYLAVALVVCKYNIL